MMKKHPILTGILLASGVTLLAPLISLALLLGIGGLLGQTSTQLVTPFDWLFLLFFWILPLLLAITAFVVGRRLQTKFTKAFAKTFAILFGFFFLLISLGFIRSLSNPDYLVKKPIIYLYPTKAEKVSVQLSQPQKLTTEYPAYHRQGWQVKAQPNGNLTNLDNGQTLYALYYESASSVAPKIQQDGFVVKGADSAQFLEKTLPKLGLNAHESEEFIIYWLPQLEKNPYNYIRFLTPAEINQNQALNVNPHPDTTIRVWMSYAALKEKIKVTPQQITNPVRKGFTLVEWGGVEIKP